MERSRWVFILLLVCAAAWAENWPQWRGPLFNGSTTVTDLPTEVGEDKSVKWKTPMPGASGATPIVWGDRVFVSSATEPQGRGGGRRRRLGDLLALCFDANTGEELWRRTTGKDRAVARGNNMASPSPVTDGQTVWFYYGTQSLFAFDFDGKPLWQRDLEEDYGHNALMFGYSSSPLLYRGRLYIVAIRNKKHHEYRRAPEGTCESYLLAIDPDTGRTLWKVDRPTDAVREAQEAYTTAIPFERDGRAEILVFGADYLTAHDPETGKELWRWGGYNPTHIYHWRVVPSPVVAGDVIVVVGPKHSRLFAIRPAETGLVGDDHVAWTLDKRTPDASTPLYYQGRLYVLEDDRRLLTCLDPQTGEQAWQGRLGGRGVIRASLTGADGKLYCLYENGEVVVLAAGDEFKILHRANLAEDRPYRARGTIAAAQGCLFARTTEKLYCFTE
ncbi:MAG: PQQ-binding-like beta-propeller repeat protein [bacterium]